MDKSPELIAWELKRPFPPNIIKTTKKPGGGEFSYIDARDLMARLDAVVGVDGWQTTYSEVDSKVCCKLAIRYGGHNWVERSDGAGDTQVAGEKGSFSDAFKRAGVQHGVARYLYRDGPPMTPERYDELSKRPE